MFYEREIDKHLDARLAQMRAEVEGQSEDYILNVNETQFVEYLVSQYAVDIPHLDFEQMSVERVERQIPAELFWSARFSVTAGRTYPKPVFIYHIPYSGDPELLRCRPNPFGHMTYEMAHIDGDLCFEIIAFGSDPEEVKRDADQQKRLVQQQFAHVLGNVESYNQRLKDEVLQAFRQRKERILKQRQLTEGLGVPLRRRDDAPKTYAVHAPRDRHQILVKPAVTEQGFEAEPTIDPETYRHILGIIHDLLKEMERHLSIHSGRKEEALRDLLLMHLAPWFEWTAVGEAFNAAGKTDILVRYQNSNLFVAECKFWDGLKAHLASIDQLLSYLTWRDSKAALVVFVRNANLSSVLARI